MELSFLRGLYDTPGPWASVYIDATHYTEESRATIRVRWRGLREALHDLGLDDGTLNAIDTELVENGTFRALAPTPVEQTPRSGDHGLALFATHGEVRYAEMLSAPPSFDSAEVGPLPHVAPLLIHRGEQIPWLRVTVDRVGADIQGGRVVIKAQGSRVYPLRKSHGGGWSQENLQRAAENTWQHNAKEVAGRVDHLAQAAGAELIIVAGDIRARQLLVEQLPERWLDKVILVEGGSRATGADSGEVDQITSHAVADAVARRKAAVLDRFRQGYGENAASGLRDTVAAFDQHQVATLVMEPDGITKAELWMGLDGSQLAVNEEDLQQMRAEQIQRVRAEDALVRAAACTDAELILVSPDDIRLDDGIGSVLRYSQSGGLEGGA